MTTSRLQQVIARFRRLLMDREQSAESTLNTAYRGVLARIRPALNRLYKQMSDVLGRGETFSPSWLYEANRLEVLQKLMTGEIDHFAALAKTTTGRMQEDGIKLGVEAGLELLGATKPPGVNWSFGVPHPDAIQSLVGATQKGSPLDDLFRGFGEEAAKSASGALVAGVSLGQNPRTIAPEVEQALDIPRWRALTIARTELNRSYRNANVETFKKNEDTVSGYIWQSALDSRTCPACIAMHGTEYKLDEFFPAHVQCRCCLVPKTRDWSDILSDFDIDASDIPDSRVEIESGIDWFERQDAATQKEILGGLKYDAWKNHEFAFADIVGVKHSDDWGDSVYVKSLKELVR